MRSPLPVGEVLGWLVAAGANQAGDDIGPSVRWLGRIAIWAVELTARGSDGSVVASTTAGHGEREWLQRFLFRALDAGPHRSDPPRRR